MAEWTEEFNKLNRELPAIGTTIRALRDGKVQIRCELTTGEQPFMYALGYLPKVVGDDLRWLAVSDPERFNAGLRLIIAPRSRNQLIQKSGLHAGHMYEATELRVIRHSSSKKAVIVEIVS